MLQASYYALGSSESRPCDIVGWINDQKITRLNINKETYFSPKATVFQSDKLTFLHALR